LFEPRWCSRCGCLTADLDAPSGLIAPPFGDHDRPGIAARSASDLDV